MRNSFSTSCSAFSLVLGNTASEILMWKQCPLSVSHISRSFIHWSFSILMKKSNSWSSLLSACEINRFFCSSFSLSRKNCKKSFVCASFTRTIVNILIVRSLNPVAFCVCNCILAFSKSNGTSSITLFFISSTFSSGFANVVSVILFAQRIFVPKCLNL